MTMTDATINGLFGTYSGNPTLDQPGAITFNTAAEEDTSVLFDGVDDTSTVTDNNLLDFDFNDAFTIELWFKTTATTGVIVSKGAAPYPYRLELVGGAVRGSRSDGTNTPSVTTAVVNDDAWHYLTFMSDGTTLSIQVDDTSVVTAADTTATTTTNGSSVAIGSLNGADFYAGGLDEIAIYATALTGTQRSTHYAAGT